MIFGRVFFLFTFLLFIPTFFYLPNPGGVGWALPFNVLFCVGAALVMVACWLAVSLRQTVITTTCRIVFLACLVLLLPILFTRPEWQGTAAWRLVGLWGGGLFYFTWLQVRMTARYRQAVLYLILLAATVQALMVLLQLFAPQFTQHWIPVGGRSLGIFQQANVTASFIATGLALAVSAFVLPEFHLLKLNAEYWRRRVLAVLLVVLTMVLVWLQSRTGWLAGALVLGAFILCFGRRYFRFVAIASLLVVGSTLVGVSLLWWGDDLSSVLRYSSHTGPTNARYAMLISTLKMIAEKPLSGWGYGGFEYSFQHFRMAQGLSTQGVGIVRHPHNELLLWWVEGGIAGLLGMLLLVLGGLRLMVRAYWRDSRAFSHGKTSAGEALALFIALLPIVLHCQTEYPFYLSTLHWLVFLLLLAMLDRLVSPRLSKGGKLKRWKYPMLALSLAGLFVAVAGGYSGQKLTQAERYGLLDMQWVEDMPVWVSWTQSERLQFDLQLAGLLVFNRSHDEQLLEDYAQWAQAYLNHRIDKNVYANQVVVLLLQRQYLRAEELRHEAALLFPFDKRFTQSAY